MSRALRLRAERRVIKAGFPIESRAFTEKEIEDYFSGDKIECLLCGRSFKRLARHLPNIHSVTEDDFRVMYGLPWRRGLTSEASHARYGAVAKKRAEDKREELLVNLAAGRAKMRASPPERKPDQPFRREHHIRNILSMTKLDRLWNETDAEKILAELQKNRTEVEVLNDVGRPQRTWWCAFLNSHPDIRLRRNAIIEAQPFDVQARGERLGKRFRDELRRLFDQGLSDHKIAKILGVTAMTSNRFTKHWRRQKEPQ